MTSAINKTAPKKKSRKSLDRHRARAGWMFVLPFLIGFICIYLPIVFESIKSSFCNESLIKGTVFVGWQNYYDALFVYTSGGQTFLSILVTGLQQLALDIPAILIFSLFMAVLLNQKMTGRAVFRAIFFIPVILSTGIMESIDAANTMIDIGDHGISTGDAESTTDQIVSVMDLQVLFQNLMVGPELATYVAGLINNIFAIVNRSGVQMLIFLAGLQSISPAIYESVQIDGATAWETFWKITFPMISPMILVNAVYTVIDSFTTDSNVVMRFIAQTYQQANGNVLSSAMAWMYFLLVIGIIAIVAAGFSAFVFYQRRD